MIELNNISKNMGIKSCWMDFPIHLERTVLPAC